MAQTKKKVAKAAKKVAKAVKKKVARKPSPMAQLREELIAAKAEIQRLEGQVAWHKARLDK